MYIIHTHSNKTASDSNIHFVTRLRIRMYFSERSPSTGVAVRRWNAGDALSLHEGLMDAHAATSKQAVLHVAKGSLKPSLNAAVYAYININLLISLNSHADCVNAPQSWWRSSLERRMWPKRCKFVGCMQDKHVSSELYTQISCQLSVWWTVCLSDCACVYEFVSACKSCSCMLRVILMFDSLALSEVTSVLAWNQQNRWDNRLTFRWSARTFTARTPATHHCSMESWTTAWWHH